jgi:predicted permease
MKLLRRLRYWLRQREMERDLAEEIDFHRALTGDLRGMGNITLAREEARAVWIWHWLQSVSQDVAYALRNLRGQPGFTAVALATLGIAIGFDTSFFTVFNAAALRPWPVKDPSRVVQVFQTDLRGGAYGFSPAEYRYLAAHVQSVSGMSVRRTDLVHLGFESFGQGTRSSFVSANYFDVFGVRMELGRGFLPDEDLIGKPENVTVLSYVLWRDRYGSDWEIVGKTIRVDELPFIVVGVAPEEFTGTDPSVENLWFPLAATSVIEVDSAFEQDALLKPDYCCANVAARLKPSVDRGAAEAEFTVLSRQFHEEFHLAPEGVHIAGITGLDVPGMRKFLPTLLLIFSGITLVLLLACANIGNLLLARAAARQKEIEVRRSVGASRGRIVRQLLTESFVLALGAGGLGLLLALVLPGPVLQGIGEAPPFVLRADRMVFCYGLGLAVLACVLFGLAPALHATRANFNPSRLRLRSTLLGAQVAISVILLIGAGLLLQGIRTARNRDPGFAIRDVAVVSFELPGRSYTIARTLDFSRQVLDSLKNTPGVGPVALTAREPLTAGHWRAGARIPGESPDRYRLVEYQEVSEGYFDVLRIPILAGRSIERGDERARQIVVNQTLARRFWGEEDPVGKPLIIGSDSCEVVGLVCDTFIAGLDEIVPTVYRTFRGRIVPKLLVRSGTPASEAAAHLAVRIDPKARTQAVPLEENIDRWLSPSRLGARIAGVLGAFALILATVGMSGVFAYVVQQRTPEIGVRMALGAKPGQVIRLVLAGSSRAVLVGLSVGFLAALPGARLLEHQLFGVSPLDPKAYLLVAGIFVGAALCASYAPARRATSIDPASALRHN